MSEKNTENEKESGSSSFNAEYEGVGQAVIY